LGAYFGAHGRSEPVLQYGYEDSAGSLHVFLEFDSSMDERVQTALKVREHMLQVFAQGAGSEARQQIRVAELASTEAKLFCLCSLAYNRLLKSEEYGGGLDSDLGDRGSLAFESLMTVLHLSHAVTVRRAVTGAALHSGRACPPCADEAEKSWGSSAGAQKFHGVGHFLDDLYEAVKTHERIDPATSWIYSATIRSLTESTDHQSIRKCFIKSAWLNDFRMSLVVQPTGSDMYHLLLVLEMPLTVAEMQNHLGVCFAEAVGNTAVMEDFIPVSCHNYMDVFGDLFACAAWSPCESFANTATRKQETAKFYQMHKKTMKNACEQEAGDQSKEDYLSKDPFSSMKSRILQGDQLTDFMNTPDFHLAVFGIHARLKSFTEMEKVGCLQLMTSPGALSQITKKHNSSRPRRVFFRGESKAARTTLDASPGSSGGEGSAARTTLDASPGSWGGGGSAARTTLDASPGSSGGEDSAATEKKIWMKGFASESDSSNPASPKVMSGAAAKDPKPRYAAVLAPARLSSGVAKQYLVPQAAGGGVFPAASAGVAASSASALGDMSKPAPVVIQAWGLGARKHRFWPVLECLSAVTPLEQPLKLMVSHPEEPSMAFNASGSANEGLAHVQNVCKGYSPVGGINAMDVSCLLNSMDAPSIPTKTDLQHILNESDDTSPGLFLRTLMSCKNIGFSLTMCVCVCAETGIPAPTAVYANANVRASVMRVLQLQEAIDNQQGQGGDGIGESYNEMVKTAEIVLETAKQARKASMASEPDHDHKRARRGPA
jgi:hypothetical protein